MDFYPRTFIFGAKAAAGYKNAKTTIKLINSVADVINNDASINGKIKVVFIEDYKVSNAELIFAAADVSVSVTEKDKDNLLISLLASKNKDTQAVSLVNSREYNLLATNIRNNTIIDRSVITVSGILQYLRRARINEAYALGREMGEIWEIRLGEDSSNAGQTILELKLPENSAVLAVASDDKFIFHPAEYKLQIDCLCVSCRYSGD